MSIKYLLVAALKDETSGLDKFAPIIHTGLGKVNAAIKLYDAVAKYQPELVINYGTAGSLSHHKGLYEVNSFVQHDMDVRGLGYARGVTPFSDDESLLDVKGIVLGTGDSFIVDKAKQLEGLTAHIDLVDMEGFALNEVCRHFAIPFVCYKFVSDSGDGDAAEDWKANVAKGASLFSEVLKDKYGVSDLL